MSAITYIAAILTMISLSIGQVLLKILASKLINSDFSLNFRNEFLRILLISGGIVLTYGVVTALWLFVLRSLDLSRAFTFASLTFVFVPLFSFLFLNERISAGTLAGTGFIVVGILVSARF